ncbi:hypothetical protein Tco_1103471 [Tanacetum coccineum]
MYGSDVTNQVRHSQLMDEFDKFAAKEGESLEYVYERLTTLMNIMDRNNVHPIPVSINTKFLNCLQLEWRKYVNMVRHKQTGDIISCDQLYNSLVQFERHVHASKAKRSARNHDPLALVAHSNACSSQSHASPSYSHSPQPYYVIHPSSVDGRVDIQTKNAGYGGNGNRNAGRQNRNQAFNARNGLTQNDETHDPYSIVDKPDTCLIYLNSKNKKRVMYLVEVVKFCDATLERVLNEVKLRIFQNEFWKKPPLLGELDLDIMKAYERERTKRLRHHEQMRRWELFVNGRPILSTMKRL